MSEKKTHWRTLQDPEYFGAFVMIQAGSDLNVTILSVKKKTVNFGEGKESHTIAELEGQKPWVLNTINQRMIEKVLGTPDVEDWIGKTITVYAAKVRAFGETMDAVRVRPTLPKQDAKQSAKQVAPEMTPTQETWAQWKEAIVTGSTSIDELKKHYTISAENEKLISVR